MSSASSWNCPRTESCEQADGRVVGLYFYYIFADVLYGWPLAKFCTVKKTRCEEIIQFRPRPLWVGSTHDLFVVTSLLVVPDDMYRYQSHELPADDILGSLSGSISQQQRWLTVFRQRRNCCGRKRQQWKKRSERRRHCALSVVRPSQKFLPPPQTPLPGGTGQPKFSQLEMVTTFTHRASLVKIDARNFELSR